MATSTFPALKASLIALLQAAPGLAGVTVSYGIPLNAPGREWIAVLGATGHQAPAGIARTRQPREERYDIDLIVSAIRDGGQQQAATERAFAIAAEIENVVRADYTIGGTVATAIYGGRFEILEGVNSTDREGRISLTIAVMARI